MLIPDRLKLNMKHILVILHSQQIFEQTCLSICLHLLRDIILCPIGVQHACGKSITS